MSERPPSLCLTFGKVSSPAMAMNREGRDLVAAGKVLGRQVAILDAESGALRLNTPGWLGVDPSLVAALNDKAKLRILCRDKLYGNTPQFSARAKRWIGSYLDLAETEAGAPDDPDCVTAPGDRFFAALLPLPAAKVLPVQIDGGWVVPLKGYSFIGFDLAFWDGRTLTAILFGDENSSTPRQRKQLRELSELLGARFALHRVGTDSRNDLACAIVAEMRNAPPPWFGPYRADGFQAPLPEPATRSTGAT